MGVMLPSWTETCTGYGYGTGTGNGYGYGYGTGDGNGYGTGNGTGNGYGTGYWRLIAAPIIKAAVDCAGFLAFWKSDKDGLPSNGGSGAVPAAPGMNQEVRGPLKLCTHNALHATLHPDKWKGDRLWVVALHGELQFSDDKIGALKREIIGEVGLTGKKKI